MKQLLLFISFSFLVSCNQKEIDLSNLQGYWEITKAENQEGKSKEFPFNETVDYIVLKDSIGFRKKVKPLYNGNFKEELILQNQNGMMYTYAPYTGFKKIENEK